MAVTWEEEVSVAVEQLATNDKSEKQIRIKRFSRIFRAPFHLEVNSKIIVLLEITGLELVLQMLPDLAKPTPASVL
jgi:hypothetical protein